MPYRELVAEVDTTPEGLPDARPDPRDVTRMCSLIDSVQRAYQNYGALIDVRNLCYYRGNFWVGDGFATDLLTQWANYTSQLNEVFPILDTLASSLAIDTPQVEMLDQRVTSYAIPTRETDATIQGRRIAAPLNYFAVEDDLDETFHEMVLMAFISPKGGVLKTTWSPDHQRVTFRTIPPWDIFWDPNAKRLADTEWMFERFAIHIDDLKDRISRGVYWSPNTPIQPDVFPRTMVEDYLPQDEVQSLREQGFSDHVLLHEWWDFRKKMVYHVHMDSRSVLLATPIPYGNPYTHLRFHFALGRAEGIPLVSIIAPLQQEINEMVTARKEIVRKLPRRLLVSKDLFSSDEDWNNFLDSHSTDPTRVATPPDVSIGDKMAVTPAMDTTFDFNKHLVDIKEHVRYEAGQADFERGQVRNIRTAAEAKMISASVEGRMDKAALMVTKAAFRAFRNALRAFQWAVRNQQASGIDIHEIYSATSVDVGMDTWAREILEAAPKFRLLPFSPMMEDKVTRRANMIEVLKAISSIPSVVANMNGAEAMRDIQEMWGFRPSIVLPPPPPGPTSAEAPAPETMGVPVVPEGGVVPPMDALPAGTPPLTGPVQ